MKQNVLSQKMVNDYVFKLKKVWYPDVIHQLKITYEYDKTDNDEYLYLDMIRIRKKYRHKGYGNRILNRIVHFADKHNVRMELIAANIFGTDLKILYKFYRRHGFFLIKKNKDNKFIRYPVKKVRKPCNKLELICV
jgi:GNAT superfamily N-acetyltransferase